MRPYQSLHHHGRLSVSHHVSNRLSQEGALANTHYILIESDGFGFGIDVERNQRYLQGRATARVNIDAFLAGRQLMAEEGYEWGDVTLNLGYSQGGHSGMWVNRTPEAKFARV